MIDTNFKMEETKDKKRLHNEIIYPNRLQEVVSIE